MSRKDPALAPISNSNRPIRPNNLLPFFTILELIVQKFR